MDRQIITKQNPSFFSFTLNANCYVKMSVQPFLPTILMHTHRPMQFYIMSMSIFGLGMVGWFFFRCVGQNFQGCDALVPGPLAFILTLFGVFEGFLFSLFTCIMFCTQVHAIATDETVSII